MALVGFFLDLLSLIPRTFSRKKMPQDEEVAISSIGFPGQALHQPDRSAEIPNRLVLEKSPTSTEANVDNLPAATVPQPSQSLAPFRGAQDDDANLQLTVPTPVPRPLTHTTSSRRRQ